MYSVIVVDDEPAGLNHVCRILESKCKEVEIIGKADNGQEALDLIEERAPDILITDVKMPIMDGITLVTQVKEKYPEILSIIVSGYSEFEYAAAAIKAGVCDYLLKPLVPKDLVSQVEHLMARCEQGYYEKRNQTLKLLCKGEQISESTLVRLFPKGRFYSAIIRKNGLPTRFGLHSKVELLPMIEEKILFYGRDELEALYLFPEELVFEGSFKEAIEKLYHRVKTEDSYWTGIIYPISFELSEFPKVARRLYRALDETIIIGKSQLVIQGIEDKEEDKGKRHKDKEGKEKEYKEKESRGKENKKIENEEERNEGKLRQILDKELIGRVEYLIRYKEISKFIETLGETLAFWKKEDCSQFYVETKVKYFFQLISNGWNPKLDELEMEYLIDDAFYYASDFEELLESIVTIVKLCAPDGQRNFQDDKEMLLNSIISYVEAHLDQQISISSICYEFGISQTTLCKMFRSSLDSSFNSYLTGVRINKALDYMKKDPSAFVKDIAERVGYNDQFYFSRIFRSVKGVSPKEYMDSMAM